MKKQTFPNNIDSRLSNLISLYGIYSKSINNYTTVIWAFPLVFIIMLGTTYNFCRDEPCVMIVIILFGYILIHAFFKHTYIHVHIRNSLIEIEKELKVCFNTDYIPTFKFPIILDNPFYSHRIVSWSLVVINSLLLLKVLLTLLFKALLSLNCLCI